MPELATAWVTLAISADGMQRQIRKALNDVDPEGAGKRAGKKYSDSAVSATNLSGIEQKFVEVGQRGAQALTRAVKGAAITAAASVTASLASSLTLGFQRLTAIDEAKSKLTGLGNSAETTAQIMDSALAAVKGTAFGLGDAATIAANAVAAGVKPGEELTNYLKMTADASAIAGSSLSDMGRIINQVRTGQKAYTDDLNQLADRGIPIYQWIAEAAGVAAGDVKKLASQGKISSEMFEKAISTHIGGAALKMGSSFKGSVDNAKAALGRLGAAAEQPFFDRLKGGFASVTKSLDDATPKVEAFAKQFDSDLFNKWIPGAKEAWKQLQANPTVRANLLEVQTTIMSLAEAGKQAWPALVQIGKSLGQASAALGVSSWKLFLTALETAAGVLKTITPALQALADLMKDHPTAVAAAAGAWLAFRTVPNILGQMRSGIEGTNTSATGLFGTLGRGLKSVNDFGVGVTQRVGSLGAFRKEVSTAVSEIQKMEPALSRSQARLVLFAGGAVQTVGEGFRKVGGLVKGAVSGVVGALGGPFSAALVGASVALGAIITKNEESARSFDAVKAAIDRTRTAQNQLNDALLNSGGEVTEEVKAQTKQRYGELSSQLQAESTRTGSALDSLRGEGGGFFESLGGGTRSRADVIEGEATRAKSALEAIQNLGITEENVVAQIQGGQAVFDALVQNLQRQGDGGQYAAGKFQEMRQQFLQAQKDATAASPALKKLGDDVAGSASKIKTAFSALPSDVPINVSAPGGQAVFDLLVQMGEQVSVGNEKNINVEAPLANEVLQLLKTLGFEVKQNNDKTITVRQVGAEETKDVFKDLVKPETKTIRTVLENAAAPSANSGVNNTNGIPGLTNLVPRSFGAIVAMAGGGLRQIAKPGSAGIYAGRGAGTIFAEQETGGEAYIPLAPSKRPRSLAILTEVARRFGLVQMADGGITLDGLKAFASGIAGRAYNWGGPASLDSDCSGAQSAVANYITGGSGRFTTQSEAGALQSRGFQMGDPPAGISAYWIGWRNGGPGGGHTAGTIVDPNGGNVNVEMGGKAGIGQFGGGAAGASDFPSRAWIALSAGDNPANSSFGGGYRAATSQELSAASNRTNSAATAKKNADQGVDDATYRRDKAQKRVDELKASGKDTADAQHSLDVANRELGDAKERQTKATDKLTKAQQEETDLKTNGKQTKGGRGSGGGSSDGQQLGQNIVSGMLQSIGLDGSVFSNPFEWPNVKSGMALANWGGGFLKQIMSSGDNRGGDTGLGGGGGMPSIGLPHITDFLKPIGPQPTEPLQPAGVHAGTGAAPGPQGPLVAYNGTVNLGVDPRAHTDRQNADMNQAYRRNIPAVRPQ